jgi:hypothetical protein
MWKLTAGAALTVLVSVALAVALATLVVTAANAQPQQANVPVFTYGS